MCSRNTVVLHVSRFFLSSGKCFNDFFLFFKIFFLETVHYVLSLGPKTQSAYFHEESYRRRKGKYYAVKQEYSSHSTVITHPSKACTRKLRNILEAENKMCEVFPIPSPHLMTTKQAGRWSWSLNLTPCI